MYILYLNLILTRVYCIGAKTKTIMKIKNTLKNENKNYL